MTNTLLSLGHGYSASALARRLLPLGWTVIGTTRSPDKADRLRAEGVEPLIWPGEDAGPALDRATHLLSSISPTEEGDPVLLALGDRIARAASGIRWAGYLSTTGVYRSQATRCVDESPRFAPWTRSRRRWAAR